MLFRRCYYLNGSHAGYILYATGEIDENDTDGRYPAPKIPLSVIRGRFAFVHPVKIGLVAELAGTMS
jgi:hypothetical protein